MKAINTLTDLLRAGISPYHAAQSGLETLVEAGFTPLAYDAPWDLAPGGRYVTVAAGTMLFAFVVGNKGLGKAPRLAASHLDWPCFKIKRNPELVSAGVAKINVEPYGGQILSTWMDRPLSAAGVVCVRGEDPFEPEIRLVDLMDPVFVIPNLAIHMNRKVNEGVPYNPAKDMQPLCHVIEEGFVKNGYLERKLAERMGCSPEDILSYDLGLYVKEDPIFQGFDGELLTSPRLDNLTSLAACLDGIRAADMEEGLAVIVGYDHEEVGSKSRQGADSATVHVLLEKIASAFGMDRAEYLDYLQRGFLLSCDVAHAVHPNYAEFADPSNQALLGHGLAMKMNFRQKYPTDAKAVAVVTALCEKNEIPHQTFFNRSDLAGGGTIGAYATSLLTLRAVDVGVPMLGMHSARETMAAVDQKALSDLVCVYFG